MALASAAVYAAVQPLAALGVAGDLGAASSEGFRLAARAFSEKETDFNGLMIVARGADFSDAYIFMVRWHGGHGPGWHSSTHLWTHREVSSLTPPSFMLFFVLLNALPQTSPQLQGSF